MAAVPRRGRFMNDSGSTSSLLRVSGRGSGMRDSHVRPLFYHTGVT